MFDSGGALLFNVSINVFSGIITLIILHSVKRDFTDTYDIRLFRKVEFIILLILLTDTVAWILDGKGGNFFRVLIYTDLILYFIFQFVVAHGWLKYAGYRIFTRRLPRIKEVLFILAPFTFLSLVVLAAPLNGWYFYLDNSNHYHRGSLFASMFSVILIYLLSVTVIALMPYKKERLVDRKRELLAIAFFAIPPFLGGLAQLLFFGFSLLWPCAVVSSLLILLNKESQAISQDALTGLNNRRNMERILKAYEDGQSHVTLIMLDIDNFKNINDKYGHTSGDMALTQAANILREIFNGTSAFLARYGGDEFVIILPESSESIAKETVQKIKYNFDNFSTAKQLPFQLSVSIGYAISAGKSHNKTEDLLREADEHMYRDKAHNH